MFWFIAQVASDFYSEMLAKKNIREDIKKIFSRFNITEEDALDANGKIKAKYKKVLSSYELLEGKYERHNQYFNEKTGAWNMFSSELTEKPTTYYNEYVSLTNRLKSTGGFAEAFRRQFYRKSRSIMRKTLMPGGLQTIYWFHHDFLTTKSEAKYNGLIYPWYGKLPKAARIFINKNNYIWRQKRMFTDFQEVWDKFEPGVEFETKIFDFIKKYKGAFQRSLYRIIKEKMMNWEDLRPEERKALVELSKVDTKHRKLYTVMLKLNWFRDTTEFGGKMKGHTPKYARYCLADDYFDINFTATTDRWSLATYRIEIPQNIEKSDKLMLMLILEGLSFQAHIRCVFWLA